MTPYKRTVINRLLFVGKMKYPCSFVNIISLENGNFDLALRKRLFCDAKPTLLPCKTAAFGTQNNRFCNALIKRVLRKRHGYEKYLHSCRFLFVHKTT